jgi:hypothetical protein
LLPRSDYLNLIFKVFNNQLFEGEEIQILDLFARIVGLTSGRFFGGFSLLLRFFLRCLLVSDDLRDVHIRVGRVYVEVLRDHYARRSGINFWLDNRFRLWFLSGPSLNGRSGLINLNFRAGQVLKDALLRRNLNYRLRLPLKSIVVKRILWYSLYLREIRWLLIAHSLLERSTKKIF